MTGLETQRLHERRGNKRTLGLESIIILFLKQEAVPILHNLENARDGDRDDLFQASIKKKVENLLPQGSRRELEIQIELGNAAL